MYYYEFFLNSTLLFDLLEDGLESQLLSFFKIPLYDSLL